MTPDPPAAAPADPVIAPARLGFQGDQPVSLDYGDIYHAADGSAEVRRVFLEPCDFDQLAAARARRSGPARWLRVGELGFGSGLNFAVAAEACLAAGANLHFVSFEAHPVDGADFTALAGRRARQHPIYRELAAAYPPRLGGWHQRLLAGGRVRLNLWLGDAAAGLADLAGRQRQPLDAWFLDGFAPDRNPALWQPERFAELAALSGHGTRVATFTAAGRVRRGLEAAGFNMRRVDQRPHKRESLAGEFRGRGLTPEAPPRQVNVIGGGLAGASAAWHLTGAGFQVRLLDGADPEAPVAPASRIPATVLHARLLADGTATAALRCQAYLYAAHLVRERPGFRAGGALQVAGPSRDAARLRDLLDRYGGSGPWLTLLDRQGAAERARWPLPDAALWLPDAGTVALPELVRGLLDEAAERGLEQVEARLLPAMGPGGAALPDGPLVLACGAETRAFSEAGYLELAPVAGQIDVVTVAEAPAVPLVGNGYLVPMGGADGAARVALGSTYEYRPWEPGRATVHNLEQLDGRPHRWVGAWRGTRSVSSDRTAIAGPLFDPGGVALRDRLVTTGHGSAGNATAHLAAAVLSAYLSGDCPPLARPVEAALSPRRFRERQARRGFRHGLPDLPDA